MECDSAGWFVAILVSPLCVCVCVCVCLCVRVRVSVLCLVCRWASDSTIYLLKCDGVGQGVFFWLCVSVRATPLL